MTMRAKRHSKESIIKPYRELVESSGERLVGREVFIRETGFPRYYWGGGYWRSWSAFQAEVGYMPNIATPRVEDEPILAGLSSAISMIWC